VQPLCSLCLCGAWDAAYNNHGDTENTEVAQRRTQTTALLRLNSGKYEKLRAAFRAVYEGDPHINDISAADLLGEYPSVRYVPPSGNLYCDVMTRLGEVASFETIEGGG